MTSLGAIAPRFAVPLLATAGSAAVIGGMIGMKHESSIIREDAKAGRTPNTLPMDGYFTLVGAGLATAGASMLASGRFTGPGMAAAAMGTGIALTGLLALALDATQR